MIALYNNNKKFKDYVDRFCEKHKRTLDEALKEAVVIEYAKTFCEDGGAVSEWDVRVVNRESGKEST